MFRGLWRLITATVLLPRIETGEKLELAKEFLPFIVNEAVDVIRPDIVFAGGFTGCQKIADLAALYYIPLTTHNVGSLVHNIVSIWWCEASKKCSR